LGTGGKLLGTFTQLTNKKSWEDILQEEVQASKNALGAPPQSTESNQGRALTQAPQQPQAAKTYNVVINGQTYKADSDASAKSLIETLKRAQQSA
jgi:hypothetical protein